MPILALAIQEVRALPRGRWTSVAAAAWLTLMALFVAGVVPAEGPNSLHSVLTVLYVLPALAFMPLAAGHVAADRATRFVQSVFTAPVGRGEYHAAKLIALGVAGTASVAATLPLLAILVLHGGPEPGWRFAALGALLTAASIAFGTLLGACFAGRSAAPAVGAASAFAAFTGLAAFGLVPANAMAPGIGRDVALGILHVSPLALLLDALGLHGAFRPSSPGASWIAYVALVLGALGVGAWIHVRHQSAEAWTSRGLRRAGAWAAVVALLAVPPVLAHQEYGVERPANATSTAPQAIAVLLVAPGSPADSPRPLLPKGEAQRLDLLVAFPDASLPLRDIRIEARGPNLTMPAVHVAALPELEPGSPGSPPRFGRFPVEAAVHGPGAIGRDPRVVEVGLAWTDGNGTHVAAGQGMVWVHVPGAGTHLLAAGLASPLACAAAAWVRRSRRR